MIGPGKYNEECTQLRTSTKARAAIAIVLDGVKGTGFSCQAPADITAMLPNILRKVADAIERGEERLT